MKKNCSIFFVLVVLMDKEWDIIMSLDRYLSIFSRLCYSICHFIWYPWKRLHWIPISTWRNVRAIQGQHTFMMNMFFVLQHSFTKTNLLLIVTFSCLLCISQNLKMSDKYSIQNKSGMLIIFSNPQFCSTCHCKFWGSTL